MKTDNRSNNTISIEMKAKIIVLMIRDNVGALKKEEIDELTE